MLVAVALVLAFIAVVLVFQATASTVFAARDRQRRVNRRLTLLEQGMSPDEVYATLVNMPRGRASQGLPGAYSRFFLYYRQAGLTMTPQRFVVSVAAGALLLWAAALVLETVFPGGANVSNVLLSLVGAVVLAALGAYVWLSGMRSARLRKVEEQLPLALDIVTRATRAGHPVISAVQLAADEMGDPIGSEFGIIVDETTYGLEFKEALANFARRTGSPEAHYFSVSVGIQSETGGNLAEILTNLANVIRSRQTLRMRVKALASEGMVSAQILSGLPAVLIGWFLLTQPTFYSSHFNDPVFWPMVAVIAVLYAFGIFWIFRIINFKY